MSTDNLKLQILNYYEMIEETIKTNKDMAFNVNHKDDRKSNFNQDW